MKSGHKSKKILSKLNQIFCEIFDDNSLKINKNTTAQDIEEWDSLNQIKIVLACEKKFKVKLKARDINSLENVGSFIDLLIKINAKI